METKQAARILAQTTDEKEKLIDYDIYTKSIIPETDEDVFRRWLFSYASVHTTWKYNCLLYKALEDLAWIGDREELRKRIIRSRAGMFENRTKYISEFTDFYWQHPAWFRKTKHESWRQFRDRVQDVAKGIGIAKSAFLAELMDPGNAEIVCVDTHILQLYGYTPHAISKRGIVDNKIKEIEDHWISCCKKNDIPPVLTRWLYWDKKQGQTDSRYWTFVFEKVNFNEFFTELVADNKQLYLAV